MKVLVTGAAGFIGHALTHSLCQRGDDVVGLDNLNHYYDVGLKQARLQQLETFENFQFVAMDLADQAALEADYLEPIIYAIIAVVLLLHRVGPMKRFSLKSSPVTR